PNPSPDPHGSSRPRPPYDPWARRPEKDGSTPPYGAPLPGGQARGDTPPPGGNANGAEPAHGGEGWGAPGGAHPEDRMELGLVRPGDLRNLLVVAGFVALAGVLLGLLWLWLAPGVPYISDGERAYLQNSEGENSVAVDGTFALLAAGIGALCGIVVFLVRRSGGVGVVVGLALGGVVGSMVGRLIGELLGPGGNLTARAVEAGRGGVFDGPLRLEAEVAILVWPLAALLTHLLVTALFGPRDEDPAPPGVPVGLTGAAGPVPPGGPGERGRPSPTWPASPDGRHGPSAGEDPSRPPN
ncbi:hypothetical protein GL263_26555, partial [Streptomyces durbertensis]